MILREITESEEFCLGLNNFERNLSADFKYIRDDRKFFNITIACNDEQLQAKKFMLFRFIPF